MDKLVVLARGLGTRMRRTDAAAAIDGQQAAAADAGIKALIPLAVAGDSGEASSEPRPFLDYVLSAAADAGYRRICIIVGPEQEAIRRYYGGEVATERLSIDFACQPEPKGTANAVAAAEAFAGQDPFAVINSDNYYPVEALRGLREQPGSALALFERDAMLTGSNVAVDRVQRFAVAKLDGQGHLERIVEKPDDSVLEALPKPLWLSMNCWRFGPSIFEACRKIGPSPRNEYEIPDAVEYAMHELGEVFYAVTIRAPVLDMTSRGDIGPVAALLAGAKVRL